MHETSEGIYQTTQTESGGYGIASHSRTHRNQYQPCSRIRTERGSTSPEHQKEEVFGFIDHIKFEIICSDELVEQVVNAIEKNAHTGLRGDGKIYVSPVEDAVRISYGERGEPAI